MLLPSLDSQAEKNEALIHLHLLAVCTTDNRLIPNWRPPGGAQYLAVDLQTSAEARARKECWQRGEVRSCLRCQGTDGGFLPGSLLSAKATMWIPFRSSSWRREESEVTLPGGEIERNKSGTETKGGMEVGRGEVLG